MSRRKRTGNGWRAAGWSSLALLPALTALWSEAAPAKPKPTRQPVKKVVQAAPKPAAKQVAAALVRPGKLEYNRDIRPILADNCFACHGPDSAARKADLRLDRPADAAAVIKKGDPDGSEFIKRITGHGPIMPPEATRKRLTPQQIATLKQWIAQGAEYEAHWSYIPPQRPAIPKVKDKSWPRNPIDHFILAKLEQANLKPAPEADRRTLARRLSLDLTGLPPEPAVVEAFVNDRSPDAYEKLVDKFMSMPAWGEHRGRYWLDAARYADTHGIHFDNYREMWSYREWVIKAFNRNMPFDQFTIEQLAGDLLPKPTLDQLIATGFNRCNITTNEGGVIPEEYAVLYTRDRTETVAQVWLGTTAGCAVCHDHKFDPLSQREFYSMAAFFNNTTQNVMDGNVKDTPPVIPVPLEEDRPRFEVLQKELADVRAKADARRQEARADFDRWSAAAKPEDVAASIPSNGLQVHLPLSEGKGREVQGQVKGQAVKLTAGADPGWPAGHVAARAFQRKPGSVVEIADAGDFEKDQGFSFGAWVQIPNQGQGGAILARMDDQHDFRGWDLWLENGRVGTHIINKWPEDALKTVTREQLKPKTWHHVFVTYNGGGNVSSVRVYIDGVARQTDAQANALKSTIRTQVPLKIGQRHSSAEVVNTSIHDVRIYERALSDAEVQALYTGTRAAWLVAQGPAKLAQPQKDELFNWWLPGQDAQFRDLSKQIAALENEDRAIRLRGTIAHVTQERSQEAMAYVLYRGEYDQRRDPVKPDTPAALPKMPDDLPRNRLGFAKWLLMPEHPLTARVTVNRFWQEVFGQGLVRTAGDFGISGELPSHPELLDWLAVEFRDPSTPGAKPWDVKRFFKLLVTSATYRQSQVTTREKLEKDADNRLLSRGPRFRMDAEVIRDYALAASGLLVRKIGGPSVKPYQPPGVWEAVAMIGSNTRNYQPDKGENLYRRSLYTFWKRSAPPASMEVFNAPNRETCVVRRERTNTPLQALVTLNDVQFVEAARHLAQRALKEGGSTPQQRIDFIARRLLARPFRAEEMSIVLRSLADLQAHYRDDEEGARKLIAVGDSKADASLAPQELAAWTMLVNQLMNLDEVLNK